MANALARDDDMEALAEAALIFEQYIICLSEPPEEGDLSSLNLVTMIFLLEQCARQRKLKGT